MGPMLFDYDYGPFRWVRGKHEDLVATDHAAMEVIDPNRRYLTAITTTGFAMQKRTSWLLNPGSILYQDCMDASISPSSSMN